MPCQDGFDGLVGVGGLGRLHGVDGVGDLHPAARHGADRGGAGASPAPSPSPALPPHLHPHPHSTFVPPPARKGPPTVSAPHACTTHSHTRNPHAHTTRTHTQPARTHTHALPSAPAQTWLDAHLDAVDDAAVRSHSAPHPTPLRLAVPVALPRLYCAPSAPSAPSAPFMHPPCALSTRPLHPLQVMDAEADREESWVRKQMQQHPGLAEEVRAHPVPHLLPHADAPDAHARAYALTRTPAHCTSARRALTSTPWTRAGSGAATALAPRAIVRRQVG